MSGDPFDPKLVQVLNCPSCTFMTKRVGQFVNHMHGVHDTRLGAGVYACSICGQKSTHSEMLDDHMSLEHENMTGTVDLITQIIVNCNKPETSSSGLSCPFCALIFANENAMSAHYASVHHIFNISDFVILPTRRNSMILTEDTRPPRPANPPPASTPSVTAAPALNSRNTSTVRATPGLFDQLLRVKEEALAAEQITMPEIDRVGGTLEVISQRADLENLMPTIDRVSGTIAEVTPKGSASTRLRGVRKSTLSRRKTNNVSPVAEPLEHIGSPQSTTQTQTKPQAIVGPQQPASEAKTEDGEPREGGDEDEPIKCTDCYRTFRTVCSMRIHHSLLHWKPDAARGHPGPESATTNTGTAVSVKPGTPLNVKLPLKRGRKPKRLKQKPEQETPTQNSISSTRNSSQSKKPSRKRKASPVESSTTTEESDDASDVDWLEAEARKLNSHAWCYSETAGVL